MKTTREILLEAQELIRDPQHWCQKESAQDSMGNPTLLSSTQASSWCTGGALIKVGGYPDIHAGHLLNMAAKQLGYLDYVSLNDQADHETVMKMFDLAQEYANESC